MNTGWKEDCIAQRTMTGIAEFCQEITCHFLILNK